MLFLHSAYSTYEHSSISKSVGISQPRIPLDVSWIALLKQRRFSRALHTAADAYSLKPLLLPSDHSRNHPWPRAASGWSPRLVASPQRDHLGRRDEEEVRRGATDGLHLRRYRSVNLTDSHLFLLWLYTPTHQNRSIDEVDARTSFATFNHRGPYVFGNGT